VRNRSLNVSLPEPGSYFLKVSRHQISRLAFLLAALLIAVTSISLIFVGLIASHTSKQQAIANEERLFGSALTEHLRAIVRDQISITSSDQSVAKLVRKFDPSYARQSFDALWTDHAHNKVMLISGKGNVLAESFSDYTHIVERPISETPNLSIIVANLNSLYRSNRVRVPGGFGHRSLHGLMPEEYAMMGFVLLDGKPALFGAMPIMPGEYKIPLPDGAPSILLSARYIDDAFLKQLNAQLDFSSITFSNSTVEPNSGPFHRLLDQSSDPIGAFRWNSPAASASIWPTVIPVIAVLSTALAALAFGIAWKIGQLTTSLQASEKQNRYLALHDSLSGLANRLQFSRSLETVVQSLPEKSFVLLHCDLDKFKFVNDTYGHGAGDLVIKTVAARLKELIADQGLVSRVGGDEFMIIYWQSAAKSRIRILCRAMLESASKAIPISDTVSVQIGLSIGISIAPEHGTTPDLLVARSDTALYISKTAGRGQYTFFSETEEEAGNRNTSLQSGSKQPSRITA
jgi:diguanylate cyclase (GGDEF)-like protein